MPDIVIDVGVNYGECLFGTVYGTNASLYGFEANPRVFACLERSVKKHPNAAQFTIHNTLISETPAENQILYVNPDWSGTASAVAAIHANRNALTHSLPVHSLDSLLPHQEWENKRILFKIDIEGYESKAMKGFNLSLDKSDDAVGILEFDSEFLTKAGESPEVFIHSLSEKFHVFRFIDSSLFKLKRVEHVSEIPHKPKDPGRVHTDLILIKRTQHWERMIPPILSIVKE